MKKKTLLIFIMAFAIFGILIAGTLTVAKYSDKVALLCGETPDNSCNTVQDSDYSYLINIESDSGSKFQIPLSLAGVVFYLTLLLTSIFLYRKVGTKYDDTKIRYFLFFVGICGVGFSAVFTWIQAYKIEAFCTYCLISAFDSVVLFGLIIAIAFFDNKLEVKKSRRGKNAN